MLKAKRMNRLALLAFCNAMRLHDDSISLYTKGRFPSAFLLSVLAQEEIGKAHLVTNYVFSTSEHPLSQKQEDEFIKLLYRHPHKQGAFLRNSSEFFRHMKSTRSRQIYSAVFAGSLEAQKQAATYTGFPRKGKQIDTAARIVNPAKSSSKKASVQISRIHNYLVEMCAHEIVEPLNLEIPGIGGTLNKKRLKKLLLAWPINRQTMRFVDAI